MNTTPTNTTPTSGSWWAAALGNFNRLAERPDELADLLARLVHSPNEVDEVDRRAALSLSLDLFRTEVRRLDALLNEVDGGVPRFPEFVRVPIARTIDLARVADLNDDRPEFLAKVAQRVDALARLEDDGSSFSPIWAVADALRVLEAVRRADTLDREGVR